METPQTPENDDGEERKGAADELGESPSTPPGDNFPSEQDAEEELPGIPEDTDAATERGDE